MGDKGGVGWIEDRLPRFPAKDNCLFTVIQTMLRNPAKVIEGILVSPEQGVKIPAKGKINILPPGKTKDIGKTVDQDFF